MSHEKKENSILEKLRKQVCAFMLEKTVPRVGERAALFLREFTISECSAITEDDSPIQIPSLVVVDTITTFSEWSPRLFSLSVNKKEGNKEESNEERKEGQKKGREGMRRKQKHRIKRLILDPGEVTGANKGITESRKNNLCNRRINGIHGKCRGLHTLESKNFCSSKTNGDDSHRFKQLEMGKKIT
ncbi:hypothetical protein MJG53_003020 [Ovis ammon polii x Ovis aries]|uniref:Uncharacterized protein n=1 Tax=Ovis ammon polii x Ovis aries TaxID=2918886 RepID=A0ACB9VFS7_9CETA|nr:hypothetical protein MJT46_004368 [Ovis ammon polii x Ovis aries]KAI4588612.1 hypothetical protein MJG53_003020 [Ovis ammon polii x Ovis aries]